VIAFLPLKQNNIKKRDNYQGVVRAVDPDGIHYDVEMAVTQKVVKRVHKETMFRPGTERTFEIARGNLFERSDSFRSDIILLPFSVSNDSFRSLLLTGCKRSPIRSRLLSYHHLEEWDGFPQFQLRRVDSNIYDNDRYDSNLSPFHTLYLYEHILSVSMASSPKEIAMHCGIGSAVKVRDPQQQQWFSAKVVAINNSTKMITVEKHGFRSGTEREMIKIDEQRLHLIRRRFNVGDLVASYCPKMLEKDHDEMYTLYKGQVVALNVDGSHAVQFQDGETVAKVDAVHIFSAAAARHRFEEGQQCVALRYDRVPEFKEESGERINLREATQNGQTVQREQCMVRHINADGSYRVEFVNATQYPLHDSFCESWLRPMDDIDDMKMQRMPLRLPLTLEIDYDRVMEWRPNVVAHWLRKCGVSEAATETLERLNVNGVFFFELDADLLMNDVKLDQKETLRILGYQKALRMQRAADADGDADDDAEAVAEDLTHISLEISQCESDMKQLESMSKGTRLKLEQLLTEKADEAGKYREWQLKTKCVEFKRQCLQQKRKITNKEIAQKFKKTPSWVTKTLKANKHKKPGGSVVRQIETMNSQILRYENQLREKQAQMEEAKRRMNRIMGITQ